MQEDFQKSTNFGQLQWLIKNLSVQRGGVRSDPQRGKPNAKGTLMSSIWRHKRLWASPPRMCPQILHAYPQQPGQCCPPSLPKRLCPTSLLQRLSSPTSLPEHWSYGLRYVHGLRLQFNFTLGCLCLLMRSPTCQVFQGLSFVFTHVFSDVVQIFFKLLTSLEICLLCPTLSEYKHLDLQGPKCGWTLPRTPYELPF